MGQAQSQDGGASSQRAEPCGVGTAAQTPVPGGKEASRRAGLRAQERTGQWEEGLQKGLRLAIFTGDPAEALGGWGWRGQESSRAGRAGGPGGDRGQLRASVPKTAAKRPCGRGRLLPEPLLFQTELLCGFLCENSRFLNDGN